jgi:prepilin-type N-terminal cleavage/methylation domain-containing protein
MKRSDVATKRRSDEGKCDAHSSPFVASSLVTSRSPRTSSSVAFQGFTLIEVLVTMLLLSILVPVLMEGISLSLRAASSSRHKTEAANLAQDQLNQLLSTGDWNTNPQGNFGSDYPAYTWQCQSTDGDNGVSQVRMTITWAEQGQNRQYSISTMTSPTLPGSDTTTTQ